MTDEQYTIIERDRETLRITATYPQLRFSRASKAIEFVRFCKESGVAKEGKRYFIKSLYTGETDDEG